MIEIACLVVLLAQAPPPAAPQPARDARPIATGNGSISGFVVTDEPQPRPVRRARVSLLGGDVPTPTMAVTDDRGYFTLVNLPPGRFMLTAAKEAHPSIAYGAKRPGRPGMSIAVADGQHVKDITLRLPRGAVITGTVLDPNGLPAQGAMVRAARYSFLNGERRLAPIGVSGGTVDDRGVYRIYGLAAGDYVVVASYGLSPFASTDLEVTTKADVTRARQALSAPSALQSAPGVQASRGGDAATARRRTVSYSPVFYPGTTAAAQAATISIAAGEERAGIDIQLQLVPTARIAGTLSVPDGWPPVGIAVTLVAAGAQPIGGMLETVRTVRAGPDGRFALNGIAAGSYVLTAQRGAVKRLKPQLGAAALPAPLWAMVDLTVDGNNQTNLSVEMQHGMTVSGRVQFQSGANAAPPSLTGMRVSLAPVGTDINVGAMPAEVDESGAFTIAGVAPGRYRIVSSVPSGGSRWALTSSIAGGRDTLDTPVEIRPQQNLTDVVLTFRDDPSEITGRLQDASGNAATDYHIIVFPADRSHWVPNSRRIQAVRPSQDGKYTLRNLPAGEYLVVAMIDIEQGEWFDPAFLQRLAPAGMRIALAENEKKTQDLQISR